MLWTILTAISAVLDESRAWYCRGAFHFALTSDGSRTLAISVDSMHRVRLDTCVEGVVRGTCWARSDDAERIEAVALAALDEATAPAI